MHNNKTKMKTTATAKFVEAVKDNPEFEGLKTAKEIFARVRQLRKEGRHPLTNKQYALWVLAKRGKNEFVKYIDMFKHNIDLVNKLAKRDVTHLRELIKAFNETLREVR